jgi:hypothetical protein
LGEMIVGAGAAIFNHAAQVHDHLIYSLCGIREIMHEKGGWERSEGVCGTAGSRAYMYVICVRARAGCGFVGRRRGTPGVVIDGGRSGDGRVVDACMFDG